MTEFLVVVDSAAKADFMREYFAERAECVICSGPLFTMSQQVSPGAPSGVLFHFEGLPTGQQCLDALQRFQNKDVLLALDSDNLSEFLCWQISNYVAQIGGKADRVKRLIVHAFDKKNMAKALQSASTVGTTLGLAFYSRLLFDNCLARHLVKLIGTAQGPGNLPLKKNSLTALFLLAERAHEHSQTLRAPAWQIHLNLATPPGKTFTIMLGKGSDLTSSNLPVEEAQAKTLRDRLAQTPCKVIAKNQSPLTIPAPEPYQLPELLGDASLQLGLTPLLTMGIVRKLYHGVTIAGQTHGFITSPQPGSEPLSPEMIAALRQQVASMFGAAAVNNDHTATLGMIIPARPELCGSDIKASLSPHEIALYDLIRLRAISSQMRPAVGRTTTIDFLAGEETSLYAHLHDLSDPGFLQTNPDEIGKWQTPIPVAEIAEGQEFMPSKATYTAFMQSSEDTAPYTIRSLLEELSDFSIAADFSTITMIDNLITSGYATLSTEGHLEAADNTTKVVGILDRAFPRMQRIHLAAYIEQTINEATSARKDLPFALTQFDQTLALHGQTLLKAKTSSRVQPRVKTSSTIIKQTTAPQQSSSTPPPVRNEAATTEEQPPPPQTPAPPAPEHDQTPLPVAEFVPDEVPLSSDETAPESESFSASTSAPPAENEQQTDFFADDDLQQAFAEALKGSSASPPGPPADTPAEAPPTAEDTTPRTDDGIACPLCGHYLRPQQTPTGKSFYACKHGNCQFMSWSIPHDLACGLCDSPYLVEKTVQGISLLRCPRAGCPYERPLSAENPSTSATVSTPPKKIVRRVAAGVTPSTIGKKVRIVRRRA
ncbi:MAG: DNA topoisomerase [Desulfobulbaceae bacterium]|nr:DNA topoisomerase [Desulfobulbaceae bacterium]